MKLFFILIVLCFFLESLCLSTNYTSYPPFSVKWVGPGLIEVSGGTKERRLLLYVEEKTYQHRASGIDYDIRLYMGCFFFRKNGSPEWTRWLPEDILNEWLKKQLGNTGVSDGLEARLDSVNNQVCIKNLKKPGLFTGLFTVSLAGINFDDLVKMIASKASPVSKPAAPGGKQISPPASSPPKNQSGNAGVQVPPAVQSGTVKPASTGTPPKKPGSTPVVNVPPSGPTVVSNDVIPATDQPVSNARSLLIGDSQMQGGLGRELEKFMKGHGYTVVRMAKPGYSIRRIMDHENFFSGMKDLQPGTVIVAAGGNYDSKEKENSLLLLQKIKKTAPDAKVIWIGVFPAVKISDLNAYCKVFNRNSSDPYDAINRLQKSRIRTNENLAGVLAGKEILFINPMKITPYPEVYPDAPDGIHVPSSIARKFLDLGAGNRILDYLKGRIAYLEKNTDLIIFSSEEIQVHRIIDSDTSLSLQVIKGKEAQHLPCRAGSSVQAVFSDGSVYIIKVSGTGDSASVEKLNQALPANGINGPGIPETLKTGFQKALESRYSVSGKCLQFAGTVVYNAGGIPSEGTSYTQCHKAYPESRIFRGKHISELPSAVEKGYLKPGMLIHVKIHYDMDPAYHKADDAHHWFVYMGKDGQGIDRFADNTRLGMNQTAMQVYNSMKGWRNSRKYGDAKYGYIPRVTAFHDPFSSQR